MKYLSKSEKETSTVAQTLALQLKKTGGVVGLIGNLGTGKTVFAKGFAKGLGIKEKIPSPTFIIIRRYIIPRQKRFFYHVDLYRLDNINTKELGLDEIIRSRDNIIIIEWADKLDKMPKNSITIRFDKTSADARIISVEHDK